MAEQKLAPVMHSTDQEPEFYGKHAKHTTQIHDDLSKWIDDVIGEFSHQHSYDGMNRSHIAYIQDSGAATVSAYLWSNNTTNIINHR